MGRADSGADIGIGFAEISGIHLISADIMKRLSTSIRAAVAAASIACALPATAADSLGREFKPTKWPAPEVARSNQVHGFVERHDGAMDTLIAPGTEMEKLAAAKITSCQPQKVKAAKRSEKIRTWQVRCTT